MIVIVMGVSGSGKTTIGQGLAEKLSLPFFDADNFHTDNNVQKMARGIPLSDDDRRPWLELLSKKLKEWETSGGTVLACSALKESYRQILVSQVKGVHWAYLEGSKETIATRMNRRSDHFMKSGMLESQFNSLEPPTYGFHQSIEEAPDVIIDALFRKLSTNG